MFDKKVHDQPLGPQQERVTSPDASTPSSGNMFSIPDIFYGGADPDIYAVHTPVFKEEEISIPRTEEAPRIEKPPSVSSHRVLSSTTVLLIILFFLLFVSGIGFAVWYFIFNTPSKDSVSVPVEIRQENTPSSVPSQNVSTVSSSPRISDTPQEDAIDDVSLSSSKEVLTFPRLVLTQLADTDIDDLTDQEEAFFTTDLGVFDSDTDGYFDGQEVVNLYSPIQRAPSRLIDSGLVREYIHPFYRYRVYYPSEWVASLVDTASQQVLINAITGDYIDIQAIEKVPTESFTAWFGQYADTQSFSDLVQFTNRFGQIGWKRADGFVAYFPSETVVFVIIYRPSENNIPVYPYIMEMMIQSFRPQGTGFFLPEQPVLPTTTVQNVSSLGQEEITSTIVTSTL